MAGGHGRTDDNGKGVPRLALFGASTMGRECFELLRARLIPVECFLDNDPKKWGTAFAGLPVRQPSAEVIAGLDIVWLTSLYANEIEYQLRDLGAAAKAVRTRHEVFEKMLPAIAAEQAAAPRSGQVAIVIADEGWILERCAREIESRLPYVRVVTAPVADAKLTYYVNYSARRGGRVSPIEVGFFTHVEERAPEAAARFFQAGRDVDVAVAMSARYAAQLREKGARDVRVITPGVDLDRFKPVVRIGVVGRTYHTGRKGEDLVRAVIDEPHLEWHFTGDGWPRPGKRLSDEELPGFYRSMDYILVPAHYEGGPMSILEALAAGVEVIAPNVGFVDEYPHIEFKAGDAEDLRRVLREVVGIRLARRRSVEHRSWDAWAEGHDRLFRELLPELSGSSASSTSSTSSTPSAAVDASRASEAPAAATENVPAEAPAVISARSTSRPRVLLALHAPETLVSSGGPAIRVPKMQEALKAHGIDADIAREELPDASGYDLVHVFNLWEPTAAKTQLTHLRTFGRPIVFSPITLDLEESLWAGRTIVPLLGSGRPADDIDRELARLLATPIELRRALGGAVSEFWRKFPGTVRELTALADHVIVLSDHELSTLHRLGALNTPYSLVHNGVDPEWNTTASPDAFARQLGIRDYALCVGTIESRKNQLLLARALRGTGIDLVLIGGVSVPDYGKLVLEVGDGRVHIAGRIGHDDPLLASAFAGARLYVLPSWCEGAPLSALEAASFGLPLVLSNRSSEREYFGPLATYCDPGSEEDMRARVLDAWALGAADDREARRARARAWIGSALTWDHAARETARTYAHVFATVGNAPGRLVAPPARRLDLTSGAAPTPGYERIGAPDFSALPYPDGVFEQLLSREGLGRVPSHELPAVLREIGRVIKPGGRLDVTTPDVERFARRYLARNGSARLDPTHAASAARSGHADTETARAGVGFDEESFTQALEEAGFGDIERHEPHSRLHATARRLPTCARGVAAPRAETAAPAPAPKEPPAVLWDGPVFSVNGYASLARHVIRALVPAGVSMSLMLRHNDGPGRIECKNWRDAWLWQRCLRRRGTSGVLVSCVTAADRWGNSVFHQVRDMRPGMQAYVGFSMFETDRLPAGWASACTAMDEIWVPSHFVRDVFESAGVPGEKLHVFPVGIDASRYDRDVVEPLPIPGRRGFMFLSIFDWSLRKGWDVLIEAYGRAFRASDDVCLVLRTAGSQDEKPIDAINAVFDRLGLAAGERPTVILLEDPVPEDEMPRLYRAADAFVLPTRGEGWGLPLMEAMVSGLPTIATRWGGHLDFMDDAVSWLIDVDGLVEVDADHARKYPYYAGGQRWAQPSIPHTAALMRKAFDDPRQARTLGRLGREAIRAGWSPERMVRWVLDRLERVEARPKSVIEEAMHAEAQGRHDDALERYAAAAHGPHADVARFQHAALLVRLRRVAEARPLFQAVADRGETSMRARALFELGQLAFAANNLEEARDRFASCVDVDAKHTSARAWLAFVTGRLHDVGGNYVEAEKAYRTACELNAHWPVATYNLASVCSRLGQTEKACELFVRLTRESPNAAIRGGSHFHLARLHENAQRAEEAVGHAQSCLVEIPDHKGAAALLERLLVAQS